LFNEAQLEIIINLLIELGAGLRVISDRLQGSRKIVSFFGP
jgi:hypothetical protein